MNVTERKMLEILKELRDSYGVLAVKAEFEAEGSRSDELSMLNEIIFRADMRLIVKIGGCEAARDLDECRLLGASGIMGPMIETPFAMSKFRDLAKKVYDDRIEEIEWIINTETKTCHENLNEIFDEGAGFLNTIAIGRVDYSGSLGLSRGEINSPLMLEKCIDMATRARREGIVVGFGGGISFDAIPFIQQLAPYADKFETRKIVFRVTTDDKVLKAGILKAMEFETLYLENKFAFYNRMANEDRTRMIMLRERLEKAKAEL
jgi:hypothetical protein